MSGTDRSPLDPLWHLLPEGIDGIAPNNDLRAALARRLRTELRYAPFEPEILSAFELTLEAWRGALARVDEPTAWREGPWPGSRFISTAALLSRRTVLASLAAGTVIRSHGHRARELTYVLSGALHEGAARTLQAGQLLVAGPGYVHELRVAEHGPCLVVFSDAEGATP